jgi:ankyrin repeat protein
MKWIGYGGMLLLLGCGATAVTPDEAFQAVDENNPSVLRKYLSQGGNPDRLSEKGDSLLYIATGPHGGYEVLKLLLEAGANPDKGAGEYTPLMNASSWCWLEGVKLLVEFDADPMLKNSKGQTALDTVCFSNGGERKVIEYLKSRMAPGTEMSVRRQ